MNTLLVAGKETHLSGWKRDLPDHRDFILKVKAKLPTVIDLRPNTPLVEDQKSLGSCVANAATSAMEYLYIKQKKPIKEMSRLFLYYSTRVWVENTSPDDDSGCSIRDAMKALNKYGTCFEKTWPYQISKFATAPTTLCKKEALDHQILSYYKCSTLDAIKTALINGLPVVGGFAVPANMMSSICAKTGIVRYPGPREGFIGGHAILFVGYDDVKKQLIFENSWGAGWGDKGYGYLPYTFVSGGLVSDCWVISSEEM